MSNIGSTTSPWSKKKTLRKSLEDDTNFKNVCFKLCLKASGHDHVLELENDAVSSVYDMAGDDKERMVYDVGIYT